MRKLLIATVGTVVLFGFYFLSVESKTYADFLPDKALVTLAFNSPADLLQKFPREDFPDLFEKIKQQGKLVLGHDVLEREFYAKSGLDPNKPIGFSLLDLRGDQVSIVFFFGVHDSKSFYSFLKEKLAKVSQPPQLTEKKIYSADCMQIRTPSSGGVCTFIDGYCVVYISSINFTDQKKIEEQFQEYILSDKNRLAYAPSYVSSLQELEETGDFFVHINYSRFSEVFQTMKTTDARKMEKIIPKDVLTTTGTLTLGEDSLEISAYNHYKADSDLLSMFKSKNSCKEMAKLLPKQPLVLFASGLDFKSVWSTCKQITNSIVPNVPQKNISEVIKSVNQNIQEEFNVTFDIEKDFLANIKGNAICAFYDLPTDMQSADFNLVFGMELVDHKSFLNAFIKIAEAINRKKENTFVHSRVGEADIWSISLNDFQNQKSMMLTPAIAFFHNHVFMGSKKEELEKIVTGTYTNNSLLDNITNKKFKDSIIKGEIAQLSIEVGNLLTQILNLFSIPQKKQLAVVAKRFQEIRIMTQARVQGEHSSFAIESNDKFSTTISHLVHDLQNVKLPNFFQNGDKKQERLLKLHSRANLDYIGGIIRAYQADVGHFPNSLEEMYREGWLAEKERLICLGRSDNIVEGIEDPSFATNYKWVMHPKIQKQIKVPDVMSIVAYSNSFPNDTIILFMDSHTDYYRGNINEFDLLVDRIKLLNDAGIKATIGDGIIYEKFPREEIKTLAELINSAKTPERLTGLWETLQQTPMTEEEWEYLKNVVNKKLEKLKTKKTEKK